MNGAVLVSEVARRVMGDIAITYGLVAVVAVADVMVLKAGVGVVPGVRWWRWRKRRLLLKYSQVYTICMCK